MLYSYNLRVSGVHAAQISVKHDTFLTSRSPQVLKPGIWISGRPHLNVQHAFAQVCEL